MRKPRAKPRVRREATPAGDVTDSEYFTDCQSLVGTDLEMDSEEFYDVPSDEEDTLREAVRNGHVASQGEDTLEATNEPSSKVNST